MGKGRNAPHDAAPETHEYKHLDCAGVQHAEQAIDHDRKHFATLQAQLAMRGYTLREWQCDGYQIARWNLVKHAPDLKAVGQFLRSIGGAQ